MLKWAVVFLLISVVAGMLGFTSVAGSALDIAKVLFAIFLIMAVILLLCGLFFLGSKT